MWAPPLNSRLSVTKPICSGTTSMAMTATNSQSRPLNSIHEKCVGSQQGDADGDDRCRNRDAHGVEEEVRQVVAAAAAAEHALVVLQREVRVPEDRPPTGGLHRDLVAERRDEHAERRDGPKEHEDVDDPATRLARQRRADGTAEWLVILRGRGRGCDDFRGQFGDGGHAPINSSARRCERRLITTTGMTRMKMRTAMADPRPSRFCR